MIICPHCGIRNRINSNFCNNCGADLRAEETPARRSRADESAPFTAPNDRAGAFVDESTDDASATDEADAQSPNDFIDHDLTELEEIDDEIAADDEFVAGEELAVNDEADADFAAPTEFDEADSVAAGDSLERLITGVHGLLPPHGVSRVALDAGNPDAANLDAGNIDAEKIQAGPLPSSAPAPGGTIAELAEADLHRVRRLLGNEPTITNTPLDLAAPEPHTLRMPWLFGILGLFVLLAFLFDLPNLPGEPPPLPGVTAAYNQIDLLPANQLILVWWAYDPATAGEMDLVTLPLLRHLTTRQPQLFLFSPLPAGVATAERLFARLDTEINLRGSAAMLRSADYLPGGPAVMPLIGQNLAATARDTTQQGRINANPAAAAPVTPEQPALVLVVAAQAEGVQDWLEQVQPRNRTPVVAVTCAAADPILRPYWDSGQLVGLVSGVDGGQAYEVRLNNAVAAEAGAPPRLSQFAIGARYQMAQIQNWGHIGFAFIILLGNLAILVHRG